MFKYLKINSKKHKGFTLMELLVVISIVGVISAVVVTSISQSRAKSRDSTRLLNIAQIKMALEVYSVRYGQYPEESHNGCYDGWETSCDAAGTFINVLKTSGILSSVPFDPVNNSSYFYSYYKYPSGSSGCTFPYAVLGIKKFESANSYKGTSAQCPSRNWYPEFDYSVILPE